jgi:exosortase
MHQTLGETSPDLRASTGRSKPWAWRRIWPWLAAVIPWVLLINYLRLEWSANEQYGYGFVVPILSLYLLLQLWPTRPAPRPFGHPGWLLGAGLFLAALLLPVLLFAEASPEWRLVGWFFAATTTGLTALLVLWRGGGPWLRHFAFPIFFILAAVPWPTSMEYKIMVPLMQKDAAAAVEILNWCAVPAVQHQNVIELPNAVVGVDEACSGIRSLQTSLMIALFVGEWLQLRLPRRALLLGAALALTYFFNLGRTLILVSLSAAWGEGMLHRWHDTVGLGVLVLSLGGLWALAVLIRDRRAPIPATAHAPTAPAPWPRLALAGFALWFLAAAAGTQAWFDWHQAREKPAPRWEVAWPTSLPTYETVEIPVEARTSFMYSTEKSSAAKWQEVSTASLWLGYFLRWDAGRETSIAASSHHPDVCLPATGKPLVADYGISLFRAAGLELPVQVYRFDDGGQPLFVFYCLWSDGAAGETAAVGRDRAADHGWVSALRRIFLPFTPPGELDYRLRAIAEGRRNLGQQVLELGLWGSTNVADAKQQFDDVLPSLVHRIQPAP